jgi:hypothetical protein
MRIVLISILLIGFAACTKEEVQPLKELETPKTVVPPPTTPLVNSIHALPEPINPTQQPLVLKQLKNNFTMYILREAVDTTVYHYNTIGEVIAEYSTYLNVGDSKTYSAYKKYSVNPENINIPDKIYATVLRSINNRTEVDFIYCDDQKRVIKEVKNGTMPISYTYDDQG